MAWFEVNVISSTVCAIEADTADEAIDFARADSGGADPGHQEFQCKQVEGDEEIDRLQRHADYVSIA